MLGDIAAEKQATKQKKNRESVDNADANEQADGEAFWSASSNRR